jgi:integrase
MPRTLRDAKLDTREARARLKVQGKPYYRLIEPGLHLGYRRLAGRPGTWCVRRYTGGQTYTIEAIKGIVADDFSDADGATVLSFRQAQREALKHKPKAVPLTVATVIEQYITYLANNGKSIEDARYRADALILPTLGAIEVDALTTEKLRAWHSDLAATPRPRRAKADTSAEARRQRRSTSNRTLSIVRAALNHAWREGHVASDAAWRRIKPFKGVVAARLRYLSITEARCLVNACDPDFRMLVEAALQTGARYSELARLQVHDFAPDGGTVHIRQSKSGRPRHIVLTAEGADFFRQCCVGRPGGATIFTRANGELWGKSNQNRPMHLACERAKIEPRITFHGLRHTWASLATMHGLSLLIVARNLGHTDTKMCERHYAHLAPSYEAESIRAHAPKFGFKQPDRKVTALRRRA